MGVLNVINTYGKSEPLKCKSGLLFIAAHGADSNGTNVPMLTDSMGRQITVLAAPIEQRNTVGALAASATFTGPTLDLGPAATRQHTLLLAYKNGVASAGEAFRIDWSDDDVLWWFATPNAAGSNGSSNSGAGGGVMLTQGRPMGRYARMVYTNGATPQTNLTLALTALAGA